MMPKIKIEPSWKKILKDEFDQDYFKNLSKFVRQEYLSQKIYPPPKQVFAAFDSCPFDNVNVVIVGQDPYHGAGQANGLCFAVNPKTTIPPSLRNIFKEIKNDLGIEPENAGDLTRWAKQGVLMINSVLTVRAGLPASHKGQGWESFTDAVIEKLNEEKKNIVYMLWGRYAQEKGATIDKNNNLVLTSAHPSPFSAKFFHGNHHFSKCNDYLKKHGKKAIYWR